MKLKLKRFMQEEINHEKVKCIDTMNMVNRLRPDYIRNEIHVNVSNFILNGGYIGHIGKVRGTYKGCDLYRTGNWLLRKSTVTGRFKYMSNIKPRRI